MSSGDPAYLVPGIDETSRDGAAAVEHGAPPVLLLQFLKIGEIEHAGAALNAGLQHGQRLAQSLQGAGCRDKAGDWEVT
jgi:hypothetical protein